MLQVHCIVWGCSQDSYSGRVDSYYLDIIVKLAGTLHWEVA